MLQLKLCTFEQSHFPYTKEPLCTLTIFEVLFLKIYWYIDALKQRNKTCVRWRLLGAYSTVAYRQPHGFHGTFNQFNL